MLAVIGTAGRRDDAARLCAGGLPLWQAMHAEVLRAMEEFGVRSLISGGAAVADHLAVCAFLEGAADRLVLRLPAGWDGRQFVPLPGGRAEDAATANRYHRAHSRALGLRRDTLAELGEAIARGAEVSFGRGFLARNLQIAREATHLLALTWGPGRNPCDLLPDHAGFGRAADAGLKPGGTAHTWENARSARIKRHVPLGWIERRLAAGAPSPAPR